VSVTHHVPFGPVVGSEASLARTSWSPCGIAGRRLYRAILTLIRSGL
jgi:hypothetical protein